MADRSAGVERVKPVAVVGLEARGCGSLVASPDPASGGGEDPMVAVVAEAEGDEPFQTRDVDVCMDVNYRDSRIKQYLKEGRALRVETVVNSPDVLGVKRRLHNLDELQAKARGGPTSDCSPCNKPVRTVPSRLRCSHGSRSPRSRRANESPRSGSGSPGVMALTAALCVLVHTPSSASPTEASAPR